MTSENSDSKVIATHFHRAFERDNSNCDESEVISYQLRLVGVEMIRVIQAGKLLPREDVLQTLRDVNEGLARHGKPLLDFDFSNLN